jgi:hypothetical protein
VKARARVGPSAVGLALGFVQTVGCAQILGIGELKPSDAGVDGPICTPPCSDGQSCVSDLFGDTTCSPNLPDSSRPDSSPDSSRPDSSPDSEIEEPDVHPPCNTPSGCGADEVCCGIPQPLSASCYSGSCPTGTYQLCDSNTACAVTDDSCQSACVLTGNPCLAAGLQICLPSVPSVPCDGGPPTLGFTPTNFDPTATDAGIARSDWASACSMAMDFTDSLPPKFGTIAMNDQNQTRANLYVLRSWTVTASASVPVDDSIPAIILVLTTVDVQGTVSVTAGGYQAGAIFRGPGAGQFGPNGQNTAGGGGASYCGIGGTGGVAGATVPPQAGSAYGDAKLNPLLPGSAGSGTCGPASNGGGALQIVAGTSIAIRQYAVINAGGFSSSCGNSAGSGGAILLEAPTVTIAGHVVANGGAGSTPSAEGANASTDGNPALGGNAGVDGGLSVGGNGSSLTDVNGGNAVAGSDGNAGGGGGAGRIRINTMSGMANVTGGLVSPGLGSACATQGTLNP